jgi:hypothetical protein
MAVHDSKNIHVFISIPYSEGKIRDTLMQITADDDIDDNDKSTTDSIKIKYDIPLYKTVNVQLMPLDTTLKVTRNHPSDLQKVNTNSGNHWSWTVLATSANKPISKLKLNITTQSPNNFITRTIPINIKVESHIFRRVYNYVAENPSVLIGTILIPLAGFAGKRIFDRKMKRGKNI